VDVLYSWGKPDYRYTRYVHKDGTLLAQITIEGDFLLLSNRLYSDRGSARHSPSRLNVERELSLEKSKACVEGVMHGEVASNISELGFESVQ
jgi:hypothetical protein